MLKPVLTETGGLRPAGQRGIGLGRWERRPEEREAQPILAAGGTKQHINALVEGIWVVQAGPYGDLAGGP